MKRTKFVLLALVAAMILMGAGYAAWSQTFTITSTVSTGELFVQVSDEGITSVIVDANGDGDYVDADDVDVDAGNADDYYLVYPTVATENGDPSGAGESTLAKIAYTIDLYPGTQVTSKIDFKNLGTIKTKQPVVSATDGSIIGDELWDDLVISVNDGAAIEGEGQEKLDNLANAIAEEVGDLEPNGDGTASVTIVQELPITSGNETENKESLDWEVEFTFEQYNDLQ